MIALARGYAMACHRLALVLVFHYDVTLSICSVTLILRYVIIRKWRTQTRFPDL